MRAVTSVLLLLLVSQRSVHAGLMQAACDDSSCNFPCNNNRACFSNGNVSATVPSSPRMSFRSHKFPSMTLDRTCAAQPTDGYAKNIWTGCVTGGVRDQDIAQSCDGISGTKSTGTAIVCHAWHPSNGKWFCS